MVGLMPQREEKFSVNATPEDLWSFIRDLESLCSCIPGVEHINLVDDRSVELRVVEKVGVIPITVDLVGQIEFEDPPHRLRAISKADHLTMEIDVALLGNGSETEITAQFEVAGEGPLKAIVDNMFERKATEKAAQFAEILKQRFGADSSPEAVADTGGKSVPAPHQTGTIRRWLYRLWRQLTGQSTPPEEKQ